MIFKGIKIRFNCENNQQYESIGDFWKYMTDMYPNDTLKGVGCNWFDNCLDYIIGDFSPICNYDIFMIKERYNDAEYIEINLPDKGWQIFHCNINDLSNLYKDIYKKGALEYEIEEFDSNGNCKISIIRA